MKVIQKKIMILVISSILISALLVIVIAFMNYVHIVRKDSSQIMQLMCLDKRQVIDEKLLNVEQSVNTLYYFAKNQINEKGNLWQDEAQLSEHMNRMEELMETTAQFTDGAVSVYYRLTPKMEEITQGIWLVKGDDGEFINHDITIISQYDKDDIGHVGWYYIPIANRTETWINPYYNENMDKEIISFVIPVIVDEEITGVVGMDVSTSLLYDNTKTVTVYDEGYAFLMDNEGRFVYHPEMKGNFITDEFDDKHSYLYEKSLLATEKKSVVNYRWNNADKKMTAQKLRNGMIFTVCVTEEELQRPQIKMLKQSVFVMLVILSIFVAATVSITKAIVRLMYVDTMTRVRNKTAYSECVDDIYRKFLAKEKLRFTVIVADINDLKKVNDTYGHDYGDMLIQNGAAVLKKIWGIKDVYRIGGDEFAILNMNIKKEDAEKNIALFEEAIQEYNSQNDKPELYLQMAIGMAEYDPKIDREYMDVFHRADNAMYADKKVKKMKNK